MRDTHSLPPATWIEECLDAYLDHYDRPPDAVEMLIWRQVVCS